MLKRIRSVIGNSLSKIESRNFEVNNNWGMGDVLEYTISLNLESVNFSLYSGNYDDHLITGIIERLISDQFNKNNCDIAVLIKNDLSKAHIKFSFTRNANFDNYYDCNVEIIIVVAGTVVRGNRKITGIYPSTIYRELA